jgi:hypothetical protein
MHTLKLSWLIQEKTKRKEVGKGTFTYSKDALGSHNFHIATLAVDKDATNILPLEY